MTADEWNARSEEALPERRAVLSALESAGFKVMEATAYGMYDGIEVYRSKKRTYVSLWLRERSEGTFGCLVHWGQREYPRSWPPEGIEFGNKVRTSLEASGLDHLVDWSALESLNDRYARYTGRRLDEGTDATEQD